MTTTKSTVRDSKQERRRAREERGLQSAGSANRPERLPPAPRERRPLLAALAVLLIVGGAAGAGLLALRADERVPVLVAAREISAGEQITEDALTTTPVAAEGTMLIPADGGTSPIGRYAGGTIAAGQLLDTSMVTDSSPLQPGTVAVGAALASGRMPASGLQPGDIVQLVRVDEPDGSVLVPDALVSSSWARDDAVGGSGGATATFIVDEGDGAQVAAVAAAGNLSAVLVTRGGTGEGD